MNAGTFLANFGHIANAPGGVQRLRELVLQLAVTGKLVRAIAGDDAADALFAKIAQERHRLVDVGEIKRSSPLPEVDLSSPLPAVPEHWRWIRLGNLTSKIGSGSTPRGGSKVYTKTGIPFLRSQNIWNDGIRLDDAVFIDRQTHEVMGNTHVLPNDILLNITGASLGRCAIVPSSFEPANVSQHVTIVRPLLSDTRHFLRVCLLSPFGQGMIWGRQVGMAREGLSKKVLEQFEIPVPPLKEQRRIVERMDELMALCDQLEAQQEERARSFPVVSQTCHARFVEEPIELNLNRIFDGIGAVSPADLRKTILTLAVQGKLVSQDPNDEPAKKLIARLSREMSKGGSRQPPPLAPMDSTQHELPASWAWAHFRDVAIIASNLVNPKDYLDFTHLAPDNIEKGTGVLLRCSTVREDKVISSNHRFFPGQVIYSKIRPNLAKVVVVDFAGLCSADMYPINSLIDARYLQRYMLSESFLTQAVKTDTRVAMPKINQTELNAIAVPVPPLAEQRRIVTKMDELTALLDHLEAQQKESDTISEAFAKTCMASFTGISILERTEKMKAPKTELVSVVTIGVKFKHGADAPLAKLLSQHEGELPAKELWQQSGLAIEAFYQQLKAEITQGWITLPREAEMRVVEGT